MSSIDWPRVVPRGVLWAVVYNLAWGVAWFAFMRSEWQHGVAAIGQPLPWTTEFWFLWAALTLPIGVAIMAHVASHARPALKASVSAAVAVWLLMTLGMTGWGVQESLPMRVLAMDSAVNLVSMIAASLAGSWSVRGASWVYRRA